jgi:probable F420-dependent oxidoreductase
MKFWMGIAFADSDHLVPLAQAAERAGFHGVAISDHILYPQEFSEPYPYSDDGAPPYQPDTAWPDPWVTIAHLAAVTEHLRFSTNVYVPVARDLFTVAKAVSTAAVLSGGRVEFGVGPGWCRDEFDQMGQDFATRGRRLNEMLEVLPELWTGDWVEHHGEFFDFEPLRIAPTPTEPIRIVVGGHSEAAYRRAARYGDGWLGVLYPPDEAERRVGELQAHLRAAGRDLDGFDITLSLLARDDLDLYRNVESLGVTGILHAPWMLATDGDGNHSTTLADRVAAIERFGTEVVAPLT